MVEHPGRAFFTSVARRDRSGACPASSDQSLRRRQDGRLPFGPLRQRLCGRHLWRGLARGDDRLIGSRRRAWRSTIELRIMAGKLPRSPGRAFCGGCRLGSIVARSAAREGGPVEAHSSAACDQAPRSSGAANGRQFGPSDGAAPAQRSERWRQRCEVRGLTRPRPGSNPRPRRFAELSGATTRCDAASIATVRRARTSARKGCPLYHRSL